MNAQPSATQEFLRTVAPHLGIARPTMVCKDGFTMSVQASRFHYCSPRQSDHPEYHSVEIGFPSAAEPTFAPYAEDADRPTDTVYGYVPVKLVDEVIAKHGGLAA